MPEDHVGIPHAIACRALEVSQSWFYKWINRKPNARQQRRARLDEQIRWLFTESGGTYGSPRIADDLREAGDQPQDQSPGRPPADE